MKTICLCGSTKFKSQFEQANKLLTMSGNVVLSVAFFMHADEEPLKRKEKARLDAIHFQKILMSDGIFVIDVGGYVGESTEREIEWAKLNDKEVVYLSSFVDKHGDLPDEWN